MSTPKTTPRKTQPGIRSLDRVVLNALARPQPEQVFTVRLRARGSVDRRLIVKASRDPKDRGAVVLHVSPASPAPLPATPPPMLTTQEAADRLNVSRPYVAQLVDVGRFKDVQRTKAGHRRIPVAEVERVGRELQAARRAILDNLANDPATRHLRERELRAAQTRPGRRWGAKQD